MYKVGRSVLGWIAILAALAGVATLLSGLVFPPGLRATEQVICPAGMTAQTNRTSLDVLRRSSSAQPYSQYCKSTNPSRMKDVTPRWAMFIGGMLVLSGLSLLVRARITPPLLRAPVA